MEPISHDYRQEKNEGRQSLSSLFSFSAWKKGVADPKMRRIELALLFGIGLALGIALKSIGNNTFTIGYQDYTVRERENRIDFNAIERDLLAKSSSSLGRENAAKAGICSQ